MAFLKFKKMLCFPIIFMLLIIASCQNAPVPQTASNDSKPLDLDLPAEINEVKDTTAYTMGKKLLEVEDMPSEILLYVDKTPIYKKNIEYALFTKRWSAAQGIASINNSFEFSDDKKEQLIKDVINQLETEDQIIENQIKSIVLYNEAVRLKLETTFEEAKSTLEDAQKNISSEDTSLKDYFDMIKGTGLTVEAYREKYEISAMQSSMTLYNLREYFVNSISNERKSDEEYINSEYEKYIDGLIKKAKIEYVK